MAKASKQTITVKSNEENPESIELIAESIIKVAEGFNIINNSRLERRAVLLLLRDITGLNMGDIAKVLDAAPKLKHYYIKPLPKK